MVQFSSEAEVRNGSWSLIQGEKMDNEPMLQFFKYEHLPESLKTVSARFSVLADVIVETLPRNPERSAALRKLLEAKDCAVRASIYKQ